MDAKQSKTVQPLTLRMDVDLHKRIKEIAAQQDRSITGQILHWVKRGMQTECGLEF